MLQKELQKLGLTIGESKVYSYLLKESESTTGPIVKNSQVAYSKVYEILERLISKGLVSFITKEKTKHYKALPPSRLKDFLEKQKQEISQKEETLENIMPKIQELTKIEKSSTEIYTGLNGVKTAYEKLIEDKNGSTVKYFFSYKKETYEKINQFYYQLFPKLRLLNISLNGISNEEFRKEFGKEKPPKFLKNKFVKFPIPSNIDILGNKILITTWEGTPTGILITSKEVSNSFEEYFDNVWGKLSR